LVFLGRVSNEGGDGKASGDGRVVVGIHGRTSGREVDTLALVVAN
jgi:hypothetical protein